MTGHTAGFKIDVLRVRAPESIDTVQKDVTATDPRQRLLPANEAANEHG
jgi:hypothetical protein